MDLPQVFQFCQISAVEQKALADEHRAVVVVDTAHEIKVFSLGRHKWLEFLPRKDKPVSFFDFSKDQMAEEIMSLLQRIRGQGRDHEGIRLLLPMRLHDAGSVKDLSIR